MAHCMKDNFFMEKHQVSVFISVLMAIVMKDNGETINQMEKERLYTVILPRMKDNLLMERSMAMEISFKMDVDFPDNSKMIK